MSHPTQTDLPTTPIVTRTVQVLHDFVRDAVSHLSEALNDSAPEFDYNVRLERGSDAVFRERKKRIPTLPLLTTESLQALPNYAQCIESLRSDAVVGPHLDRLVGGTNIGSRRLGVGGILGPLIFAMSDEEGHLTFTSQKFYKRWQEFGDFFGTDRIVYKTVAPLPNLIVPAFPLRLNNEVFLDRLTEDEVTRCYQLGMIRPHFSGFHPIVYGEWAVGIRRITFSPKLIREGDEPLEPLDVGDEGSFGDRPLFRSDIIIDDVLSTLRLFKHTQIRAAGLVSGADPPSG